MGKAKISWTSDNDAKLLVAILSTQNIKPNCAELAEKMMEMTGCEVTASSIQNRLVRIKRQVQNTSSDGATMNGTKQSTLTKNKIEKRKKMDFKEESSDDSLEEDEEGEKRKLKEKLGKKLKMEAQEQSGIGYKPTVGNSA